MRRTTTTLAALAAIGLTLATAVLLAPDAGSSPAPAPPPTRAEEHCVVRVTDQDPTTGELHVTDPVCAATRPEALQRAQPTGTRARAAAAAQWPIGVHFDGPGYTGSSYTVMGADCTGGWLNLPAAWSNRISSTMHGCPRIKHFDGYYLIGANLMTIYPGGTLTTFDNRTSSIQYLP